MKRALCILTLFALLLPTLLLSSCDDGPGPLTETHLKEDFESTSETASESESETDYHDIEGIPYEDYSPILLSFEGANNVLRVTVPEEWELVDDGKGDFLILYEGEQVGSVTDDPNPPSVGEVLHTEDNPYGILPSKMEIVQDENGRYYRLFHFYFEDGSNRYIRFCVNYEALPENGANRLLYSGFLRYSATDPGYGMLGLQSTSNLSILVLGNSFVSTSDIGNLLRAMVPSDCTVTAISRGYATVDKTYSQDTELLYQLRNGEYDVVLLCGFYGSADTSAAQVLLDACRAGNAKLALFPAHNENSSAVESAVAKYGDSIYLIDWMGELNALIKQGVSLRALAVDDTYGHSTPLAGYVGAHMIYRAVYGKNPPSLTSYSGFDQGYVDSILGTYAQNPAIQQIDPALIQYFKK